ncbi:MAG TPA: DUF6644 family protein [Gammaproteobacteria bacterium]|nr:DUF6644 family protein [Gammaproteobacteria bacterium]
MFADDSTYAAFWLDLARSDLATWMQLTPYAYATAEGIHLVGVAFFFGSIFLLDLRLLGLMPQVLAGPAGRFLLRISAPAFLLLAVSGALLFVPSADRYAVSPIFFIKVGAITVGGLNALAFHVAAWRRVEVWGQRARTPWTARTAAAVSILVWITVIALGRWMGYERRDPPAAELELPFAAYSGSVTPDPPSSDGKSLSFGSPSFIPSTVSA